MDQKAMEMRAVEEVKMVVEEMVVAQLVETVVAAVEAVHRAMTGLQTGSQHLAGMRQSRRLLQMSPQCTLCSTRRRTARRLWPGYR